MPFAKRTLIASAFAAASLWSAAALAADHRVEMYTKSPDGERNVFVPLVVYAKPGDTVTFVPTQKGHNSVSMKKGLPEGSDKWKGRMNKEITVTVSAEGVYMYKCTPHLGLGMIGAVVVGQPVNLEQVKTDVKYPGKAKKVAKKIFEEIEANVATN